MAKKRGAQRAKAAAVERPRFPYARVVLAVAVLIPLVASWGSPNQFQAVDIAAAVAGAAGVAAAVVLLLARWRPNGVTFAGVAWSFFLVAALAAGGFSGRGWSSFMGEPTNLLGWGLLAALTVTAIAGVALREATADLFGRYAWMALLAESVLAFARISPGRIGTGTLPNSTIFGIAVVLLLPWTVQPEPDRDPLFERARWITALTALAALAASGSRVALLAALVWALATVWRRAAWNRAIKAAVAGGIAAVSVLTAALFAGAEFVSTLSAAVVGARPAMWGMAARAVAARPVLGWGADGFPAGASAISTPQLAERTRLLMIAPGATDPHDLLVWVAVSTGVIGLLCFLWFAIEVVRGWNLRDFGVSPAAWSVAAAALVYLTAPAAVQTLPMFALMLGVSMTAPRPVALRTMRLRASVLASVAVAVLAVSAAAFALDAAVRMPLEVASAERSPAIAPRAQEASDLWAVDAHLAYLASLHWGYASLVDPTVAQNRPDLAAITRAADLDRRSAIYATERARTLTFYGQPFAEVTSAYQEVFRRYPAYPVARALWAVQLAQAGKVDDARRELGIAKSVDSAGSSEAEAAIGEAEKAVSGTSAP